MSVSLMIARSSLYMCVENGENEDENENASRRKVRSFKGEASKPLENSQVVSSHFSLQLHPNRGTHVFIGEGKKKSNNIIPSKHHRLYEYFIRQMNCLIIIHIGVSFFSSLLTFLYDCSAVHFFSSASIKMFSFCCFFVCLHKPRGGCLSLETA